MIECVYFTPEVRCYRDGSVERMYKRSNHFGQSGKWIKCEFTPMNTGYIRIEIDEQIIKIHRLIAFCFLGLNNIRGNRNTDIPDHINKIKTDNRVDNLRIVNVSENAFNRNPKGCYFHKKYKKWCATIKANGKQIHLGSYDTEEEARNAYLTAKEIHHVI